MPRSTSLSDNFSSLSYNVKESRLPKWFYNPETGGYLGKTGTGWIKLLFFYVVLYGLLAFFWVGMMSVFLYFIVPEENPLRTGEHSLLRLNPGLGVRPQVDHNNLYIRFSPKDPQTYIPYVQNMDAYLDQYQNLMQKDAKFFATCKDGKKNPDNVDKICRFDLAQLGSCSSKDKYGYESKTPCVFIKLNKIYGWLPNPEGDVKHPIVKCEGANPLDAENIGKLSYFPSKSYEGENLGYYDNAYYPYIGQADYVSPFVAVKFEGLKKNVIVHVSCKLMNIPDLDESSYIKFEIAIDE